MSRWSEFSERTKRGFWKEKKCSKKQKSGRLRPKRKVWQTGHETSQKTKPEEGQKSIQEEAERCQQRDANRRAPGPGSLQTALKFPRMKTSSRTLAELTRPSSLELNCTKEKLSVPEGPLWLIGGKTLLGPQWVSWVRISHSSATYRLIVLELLLPILCDKFPKQPCSSGILLWPLT